MREIAKFVFNSPQLSGFFIYEQGGVLAGIEVHGLEGDAPTTLPTPEL